MDHGGKTGAPGHYNYIPAKTEAYTYYANGRLKTKKDRNGKDTEYSYDIHGRLISQQIGSEEIAYTYDGNGNQLTMTDDTGVTERTYDAENRVLSKTVPSIGTIYYEYDILEASGGYSEKSTDPEGNATIKVYDKVGRLAEVTEGNSTTSYEYYDNGSRKSVVYPGGAREDYTYYDDGLLKTLVNKKAGGTMLDSYSYTYDAAHNQTSKTDGKGVTSYEYDSLNRLSKVTEPSGKTTSYLYDKAGNRTQETVIENSSSTTTTSTITTSTTTTYEYNEQNRLTETVTTSGFVTEKVKYDYDNNGNTLVKVKETTKPVDPDMAGSFAFARAGTTTTREVAFMEYNVWNQMVKTIDGDKTLLYRYNGEGYRVEKAVNGQITRYMYEADKVILEVDGQGNETAKNTYGTGIISRTADNDTAYYMYNGHGDVTALLSDTGDVLATYYYDAFGNITEETGEVDNPIRYAGYQYDEETGIYYLNARYYDPKIARFLTEDTYRGDPSDPLSLNLYTYCHNEPLMYSDPSGLRPAEGATSDEQAKIDVENAKKKNKEKEKKDKERKEKEKKRKEAIEKFKKVYNQVFGSSKQSKVPKPTLPNAKKGTDDIGEEDFSEYTIEEIEEMTENVSIIAKWKELYESGDLTVSANNKYYGKPAEGVRLDEKTGNTEANPQITPEDLLTMDPVKTLLPAIVGSISLNSTSTDTSAQSKLEKVVVSVGATIVVIDKLDTMKDEIVQKLKDVFFADNKKKDSRLHGEPGDINTEDNTETLIGPDGRAVKERHNTPHGNPKIHSNPHDHDITWDADGNPHFGDPQNYWDGAPPPLK